MHAPVLMLVTAFAASVAAAPLPITPIESPVEGLAVRDAEAALSQAQMDVLKRSIFERLEEIVPVKRDQFNGKLPIHGLNDRDLNGKREASPRGTRGYGKDGTSFDRRSRGTEVDNSLERRQHGSEVPEDLERRSRGTEVDNSLERRSRGTEVDGSLDRRSRGTEVDGSLERRSRGTEVNNSLERRSRGTEVDNSLERRSRGTEVDSSLDRRSRGTEVDDSLE